MHYCEIYDRKEEILEPPLEICDAGGNCYKRTVKRVEELPVTGRTGRLAGQVVYREVGREAKVPETGTLQVTDEVSGICFEAELPLKQTVYEKERWKNDLEFRAVFHSYGASSYRLGEVLIPHTEERPSLEACEAELLRAVGLSTEEARLETFCWEGEPYEDEMGILCRTALVTGLRRVWDCLADYEGEAALPDYTRYQVTADYERTEADPSIAPGKEQMGTETVTEAVLTEPAWKQWMRRILRVTISLLLLVLLLLAIRLAWRRLSRLREEE